LRKHTTNGSWRSGLGTNTHPTEIKWERFVRSFFSKGEDVRFLFCTGVGERQEKRGGAPGEKQMKTLIALKKKKGHLKEREVAYAPLP